MSSINYYASIPEQTPQLWQPESFARFKPIKLSRKDPMYFSSKICENPDCEKVYHRSGESNHNWENKRFCNHACFIAYTKIYGRIRRYKDE